MQDPISLDKRREVYEAIYENMRPDDRYPCEIIANPPYSGNEDKYLRVMASFYNIKID